MFATPLSPTGQLPATHFISSGWIGSQFAALLTDADAMYAAAQAAIVQVTLAQCQALIAESDVTDPETENPFAAMARLGLVMVTL